MRASASDAPFDRSHSKSHHVPPTSNAETERDSEHECAGQEWTPRIAWWSRHDVVFFGFEGQHQAERYRRGHVDPQDLHGQDRQSRPDHDRDENDESFTDVGRQRPGDEFREVVEYPAAFFHRGFDGGEVIVGEDHVGGFLGDLGTPLPHRDADVCLLQCGRVVDTVTRHRDHVVASLQCFDQAQLLFGRYPSEDLCALDGLRVFGRVELSEVSAGEHRASIIGGEDSELLSRSPRPSTRGRR